MKQTTKTQEVLKQEIRSLRGELKEKGTIGYSAYKPIINYMGKMKNYPDKIINYLILNKMLIAEFQYKKLKEINERLEWLQEEGLKSSSKKEA